MNGELSTDRARWLGPAGVFAVVLLAQLWLVAAAGTDIPFHDQWNIEGQWLYPAWLDGSLRPAGLVQPFNEHRILWTHLLNLGLFSANGQWDPLVQLVANAGLRGICAAGLAWLLGHDLARRGRLAVGAGVAFAFLPHLAWHNVLWGIESHAAFVLGFSVLALALLEPETRSVARTLAGLAAGGAALLAMGLGAFVPIALLGLWGLRVATRRAVTRRDWTGLWPALVLLGTALALRVSTVSAATDGMQVARIVRALGRTLAWPHVAQPWAALALNLPLALLVTGRLAGFRRPAAGEDRVLLLGGWAFAAAVAAAWLRGAGGEFEAGVPSRYVDFLVLLPLANAWAAIQLARDVPLRWKTSGRLVAVAWGAFLLVGWFGLSAEVFRRLILPRMRDREAPVRLVREFQRTGDAAVFAGQPRILVPHPDANSIRQVLDDPRLRGKLPPSLQPERPQGPLSRAARTLLGRRE